jgi:fumarate hydratase class I
LPSKAINHAKVAAFPKPGMEANYEFEVSDMPNTIAVDTQGKSVHIIDPQI